MSGPLAGRRVGLLTASASRSGGGVFEAVVAHAALIRSLGGEVRVFALDDADAAHDKDRLQGCAVDLLRIVGPRQVGYAPDMVKALCAANLDILHLHGIWMYPSRAGAAWAARTGRPYFVSPHGMLDPWITARGRWKKRIARIGYERASWARAAALHALTAREATDIARESGRSDSLVIPNAGPALAPATAAPAGRNVVYIGRVHPKKNLVALAQGWLQANRPAGARLLIAGWGDPADVAELEAAIATADGSVEFLGPVFGERKAKLLAEARLVVLPSHSEGLPMAMLEAWASGVPTVMTEECNLAIGFDAGAAIRCGYDAPAIAAALTAGLGLNDAGWSRMSDAARALADTQFSQAAVAAQWAQAYGAALKAQAAA
ncbi:glycosyltransferase [Novosphingobium lentum]|uniref:glycosyltransferase n=1 Tax=Novosphingobium lentum TaxID=145287 RepID=UPI00082DA2AC|nr:glycosyltransferase [Novosphingobium lentum]